MSNQVSEQFDRLGSSFGQHAAQFVRYESERLGFELKGEVWRGVIYQRKKVGSVIAHGLWRGRPAVVKLQGLKPAIEEAEILRRFNVHTHSSRIRVPKVLYWEPWNSIRGYGFMIMEEIVAGPLYQPPWANEETRNRFRDFYTEFHYRAVSEPWIDPEDREKDSARFLFDRLQNWMKINFTAPTERRLPMQDQEKLVSEYGTMIERFATTRLPMIFTHSHLGPDDIRAQEDGTFVLLSNFFWGWRPLWYDLLFNVWAALLALWHEPNPHYAQAEQIVEEWFETYRMISAVRADTQHEVNLRFMLLERCMGSLLVDLVVAERGSEAEAKRTALQEIMLNLARRTIREIS